LAFLPEVNAACAVKENERENPLAWLAQKP
jgi:hypothetical protein